MDEQRDRAHLVELLEVAGFPGGQERDERQPREDEERIHHPVGHDPARLVRLGLVVGKRDGR